MDSQIVEDPVFKHRLKFERGVDESGAETVIVEMWVDPGGGVTPHIHPGMEERFTVLAGRAEFLAGRTWVGADAGETVVVPAGMRHAYRNRGDVIAHVRCVATPPDPGLEDFLTRAAGMGQRGRLTRHGVPKSFDALLEAAVMLDRNRDMVTILFPPLPPPWIQRLLVPRLARLGEKRGYGAAPAASA